MSWPVDDDGGARGPLAGVRVLELARIIAGPLAGLYLADLGADVLKIERPGGDEMRRYGPSRWDGVGTTFLSINRNKRSRVLDLTEPGQRDQLRALVAEADVLVESYRPGVMARWGLGFDDLVAINPRLIMCSITGFGGRGPAAELGANNLIAEAFGGSLSVGQDPDERMVTGAPMTDYFTGTTAALAIVSRLAVPREQRRAVHIETSLLESQAMMMSGYILGLLGTGVDSDREAGLPFTVPNQAFTASDGRIVLAANSEDMWRRLCVAVERPEWLDRPEYATNALRMQRQDEIVHALDEIIATRSRADWLAAFHAARVTAGPINTVGDLIAHPQAAAMELLVPLPGGEIEGLAGIRLPFTFDGRAPEPGAHRPPPTLDDTPAERGREGGGR